MGGKTTTTSKNRTRCRWVSRGWDGIGDITPSENYVCCTTITHTHGKITSRSRLWRIFVSAFFPGSNGLIGPATVKAAAARVLVEHAAAAAACEASLQHCLAAKATTAPIAEKFAVPLLRSSRKVASACRCECLMMMMLIIILGWQ